MTRKISFLLLLTFSLSAFAKERAAMIEEGIAIFYPDNFEPERHLPSFALVEEPKELRKLDKDFPVQVHFTQVANKSIAYINIEESTDLYGTGEVLGDLHRNGYNAKLWNTDNYSYGQDKGIRLYKSHPWVLAVRKDGTAFGVLADNTWKQEISLVSGIQFTAESPAFRVIVIERNSPQEVVKALGELTGKMELPPLWSLGFQQSRYSYYPDTVVENLADTYREKQIPIDVIWMDIDYMDKFKVFTFSPKDFPEPAKLNKYLHDRKFKAVYMIDPGVAKQEGYFVYDSGTKADVWTQDAKNKPYVGNVWPGPCVFPDYTMERTQKWWAGLYKDFMATGIDGVWNDMNDPAVFTGPRGSMPEDNIHRGGDKLPQDIHRRYHNAYGNMMVKASREGIMAANPDKRPFILSRSIYTGGQRYAASWTGDNVATWEHLKMSIPMSINLGLSGQAFNGPDIGGFVGDASPELFAHWISLGAFYPFSRAHTGKGTKPHEPWEMGEKVEKAARTAMNRRYRLMPYLYTLFQEASVNGMPVMRPTFFAEPSNTGLRREQSSFLLGEDLMVIPQWAENTAMPAGKWRAIKLLTGDAEEDAYQPKLKLRPGAILPISNIIQATTDYNLEELKLLISLDEKGEAAGTLYHDAGDGYGYKQGKYSQLKFSAKSIDGKVVVKTQFIKKNFPLNNKILRVELYTDKGIFTGKGKVGEEVKVRF